MTISLKTRWKTDVGLGFVSSLSTNGRSGNGYEVTHSPFGTIPESGLLDFRGLTFPERTEWRRISIKDADLKSADLNRARIESCTFTRICFDNSSLKSVVDRKNIFDRCSFDCVGFNDAVLGYLGTRFLGCRFAGADFRGSRFIRPEFDDCLFADCIFEGVDFNAGSFERCEFKGTIRGVWFRGEYAISPVIEQFSSPRRNRMNGVSFREARLLDVTFSNGCDLSTVTPPSDGKHRLFDHWPQRIEAGLALSSNWPDSSKSLGQQFFNSCKIHAKNQDWYLVGEDELIEIYGAEVGTKIWITLQAT